MTTTDVRGLSAALNVFLSLTRARGLALRVAGDRVLAEVPRRGPAELPPRDRAMLERYAPELADLVASGETGEPFAHLADVGLVGFYSRLWPVRRQLFSVLTRALMRQEGIGQAAAERRARDLLSDYWSDPRPYPPARPGVYA